MDRDREVVEESLSNARSGVPSLLHMSLSFWLWNGFRKWNERKNVHVLKPLNVPNMRNIFVSAVESSTAVGTFDTRISCVVQAWTSI